MKECDKSTRKIHIDSNVILSISLLTGYLIPVLKEPKIWSPVPVL